MKRKSKNRVVEYYTGPYDGYGVVMVLAPTVLMIIRLSGGVCLREVAEEVKRENSAGA